MIKKTVFGGYNKKSVNEMLDELTEKNEQLQSKLALTDTEFRLTKENMQRNLESLQTELAIKQKANADLSRALDEKNQKISELEEKYAESRRSAGLYEEQVRKIGQIYVDAREYTDKIKKDSKAKSFETIDQIFSELDGTREQYETAFHRINQKKSGLKQLTDEMEDMIRQLRGKIVKMDDDEYNLTSTFSYIKTLKDQVKDKIRNDYRDRDPEKNRFYDEDEAVSEVIPEKSVDPAISVIPVVPVIPMNNVTKQENQYADSLSENPVSKLSEIVAQIEELQKESKFAETPVQESTATHREFVSILQPVDGAGNRSEKERNERENYSRYFAEIGKRYSKEGQPSTSVSSSSSVSSSVSTSATATAQGDLSSSGDPVLSSNNENGTDEMQNPKKPNIKEILNRYANMK